MLDNRHVAATRLSDEILGWARLAGYTCDTGAGVLTTLVEGCHTQLSVREAARGRVEVREDIDAESRLLLYAVNLHVAERHLFALLGDDIRAQLDLPFLDLRAGDVDIAEGYSLDPPVKGFQTLVRAGTGPVAAAPWPGPTLGTLVPLSHLLGLGLAELKRSFLHQGGAPLLERGRYRYRPRRSLAPWPGVRAGGP